MYQKGYIYKLSFGEKCYYGSTRSFNTRKTQHKYNTNKPTAPLYNKEMYVLMRECGWNNVVIEILEYHEDISTKELRLKEAEYILSDYESCFNKGVPTGLLSGDGYERAYYLLGKHKDYYIKNKEKFKAYYRKNRDKLNELSKSRYRNRTDEEREKEKETIQCQCGSTIQKRSIKTHSKSKKHTVYIEAHTALVEFID